MKNLNNYTGILIAGVAVVLIVVAVKMGWFKKSTDKEGAFAKK